VNSTRLTAPRGERFPLYTSPKKVCFLKIKPLVIFVGEKIDEAGGVFFSTVAGSDFVTDIPYHRWDHELYYDSDPNCWLQVLLGKAVGL